jgi:hypothetical protein
MQELDDFAPVVTDEMLDAGEVTPPGPAPGAVKTKFRVTSDRVKKAKKARRG